jgi:hypothetical protein
MVVLQIFTIIMIFILGYIAYAVWFKDLGKKYWEHAHGFILPDDQRSFIQVVRILITIALIGMIVTFISLFTNQG